MLHSVHRGCNCPRGFEGEHCEFTEGTNPHKEVIEEKPTPATPSVSSSNQASNANGGLSGSGLFVIVLAVAASFSAGIITAYRMKRKKLAIQEAADMAFDDHDLAFDADGNRMTNISIGDDPAEREGELI